MIGLHEGVHLGGWSETGTLRTAGAKHLAILDENFAVGPCASDPARHAAARRGFWAVRGGAKAVGDLGEMLRHAPANLDAADWIDDVWKGWLQRWWLMDAWRRARIKRPLWLVPAGVYNPAQAGEALERAEIADAAKREQGEVLWRAFAADDPRELDRLRRLLDLPIARNHGAHFPVAAGGRIEPAPLDALLLSGLTVREWRAPSELMRQPDRGERISEEWLVQFGDLDVIERLLAWTQHPRRAPALEMRTLAKGAEWSGREFRLTRAGRKLLDEGTRDPGELAPRAVGGALSTKWLRRALPDGDYELVAR